MLKRYEKFLEKFDEKLLKYFEQYKPYLTCQKGCSECCEIGEYPFSRLEMEYLMKGFISLPADRQKIIKENIKNLQNQKNTFNGKRFMYTCPFLINKECSLYKYRGIVCRTFGLAYVDDNKIILPECANNGLSYKGLFDKEKNEIILDNPIRENLHTDKILKSELAESFEIECGMIKPLIEWFDS